MNQQKSDSKRQIYNIFRIAALFLGAAILFYACKNDLEKIKAFTAPEELPLIEATNIKTLFTDSGEVRFFLKAPRLLNFETTEKSFNEFPEGIELIEYDENQQIISSITADYARQFEKEKKWEAKNNVIATNARGDTLKTELLIWEEEAEKIYTEEFVKIIRADQIITGIGFTSDQSLQNWRIKDPKGTIYINLENEPAEGETETNKTKIENKPVERLKRPLELQE
ncbi:MAG TPA: LPS export ABC transporter periplasmic protein LptC [Prolixibacteraceae bacterium]|nr:LPS export ABC transporter periplasmic protein LptC [Prolixibacteraceae bacterium]